MTRSISAHARTHGLTQDEIRAILKTLLSFILSFPIRNLTQNLKEGTCYVIYVSRMMAAIFLAQHFVGRAERINRNRLNLDNIPEATFRKDYRMGFQRMTPRIHMGK